MVVVSGLLAWISFYGFFALEVAEARIPDSTAYFVLALVDLAVFIVATCLLPLRRRAPATIAIVTSLLGSVSTMTQAGAAQLAAISNATHRRWLPIVANVVAMTAGSYAYSQFLPTGFVDLLPWWIMLPVTAVSCLVPAAFGLYIGARRALLSSLHERALEAERERELQLHAAQAGERTRIAREMHDVLAHRISLVAMHAGALAYREDLTPDQTRRAAGHVQDNARRALTELRQVLGVLRTSAGSVEPPQPTLAALPGLIEEVRAAGVVIDAEGAVATAAGESADPPELVSRTAFRVVQEALTNARKHAPGAPIRVRVDGRPGGLLTIEVTNGAADPTAHRSVTDGGGMGLAGLGERVELVGGTIEHGPNGKNGFAVRAWLPWEEEDG